MRIQAQQRTHDGHKFDSIAECCFYKAARARFKGKILVHEPCIILPPSKDFEAQKWKVDFSLVPERLPIIKLRIEFKGGWCAKSSTELRLLKLQCRLYERENPLVPLIVTGDEALKKSLRGFYLSVPETLQRIELL